MSRRRSRSPNHPPTPVPAGFVTRMSEMLGPDAELLLAALQSPPPGLRVNTLRLTSERFRAIFPFPLEPLPIPVEGFALPPDARAGSHPYHAAGLYYLQDPGAMVVAALPPLRPGMRVLDLAAAPGGKATHLAARMGGAGVLIANDVSAARAWELAGNLERCGVRNAIVTADDPGRLAERWGGEFDLVLVDAPCSGESMFHKSEAARREWSPAAVRGCALRQGELLESAVRMVRPGGMLLYSTCTFSPEENEQVLAELLRSQPDLTMEPLPQVPGAEAARPEWGGVGASPDLARAIRLWPHRYPGAGHFVGAMRRRGDAAPNSDGQTTHRLPGPDAAATELLGEFLSGQLHGDLPGGGTLVAAGEEIHALPDGAPPLDGLRVLRPGWWLGTVRPGRFEPSHWLAMAMDPGMARHRRDWAAGAAEVAGYLRGESLRDDGPPGWVLITVDGFPLGWGKRSGGVLKNHYPKGLRTR